MQSIRERHITLGERRVSCLLVSIALVLLACSSAFTCCCLVVLGDVVLLAPRHVCTTFYLYSHVHVVENGEVVDCWPITCRHGDEGADR